MAFALQHKETGEYWKGKNVRYPKLYATAGTARNALSGIMNYSGSNYNGARVVLGMTAQQFRDLVEEGINPSYEDTQIARQHYIDTQRRFPNDRELIQAAGKAYRDVYDAYYKQLVKNRKKILNQYTKWEVVEI